MFKQVCDAEQNVGRRNKADASKTELREDNIYKTPLKTVRREKHLTLTQTQGVCGGGGEGGG